MPRQEALAVAALSLALAAAPAVAPLRAQAFDVMEATIPSLHAALRANRTTCREVVRSYLDRIAAFDKQGPSLNAIQNVHPRALAIADSLDASRRAREPMGPLHCVPVVVKDQIETSAMPTTYGSKLFADFTPDRDATTVLRLQAAGAIVIAKATMGEFAQRYVSSSAGIIRNAYDPTRNPSGSSGGTASAVAANFGLVGIGEDTGGSIRGPAAVSNLVGLRPTLPLISRFGMMPATPTQDTMGPMTRTVADAARVLDVIAGYDPKDPVTAESYGRVPPSYSAALEADALRGVRLGVLRAPRDSAQRSRDPEGFAAFDSLFDAAVADLRALGAEVVDSLDIPVLRQRGGGGGNDYETEAATNAYLAEHPNAPVKTLADILTSGEVVPWRARSLYGSAGQTTNDLGYLGVMKRREAVRTGVLQAMADQRLEAIIYLTFDAPATVIAEDVMTNPRPTDGYGLGDNRGLSPTLAYPALTVPAGFAPNGMPAGLEFLGRPFSEAHLLAFAFAYEQRTKHRRAAPTAPALAREGR